MDYTQTFHVTPPKTKKDSSGNNLLGDAIGLFHWQWQIMNSKIK